MKKKILGAFSLAVACAGAMVYSNQYFESGSSRDAMLLENVEALSETDAGSIYLPCYYSFGDKCIVNAHTANSQGVITVPDHKRVQA